MATALQGLTLYAAPAGEDLTAYLFHFATVRTTDGAIMAANTGDLVIGVIIETNTLGNPASVQCDGISKVVLAAQITAGVAVGPSASPRGRAVAASGTLEGITLTGGKAGEVVSVLLR